MNEIWEGQRAGGESLGRHFGDPECTGQGFRGIGLEMWVYEWGAMGRGRKREGKLTLAGENIRLSLWAGAEKSHSM